MHNLFRAPVSRRALLKIGAASAALLAIPAWSGKVIAQTSNAIASKLGSPKPDGLISFNAGWQIPVEDQKALLALEEKKIKEAQAAAPKGTPVSADAQNAPIKRSWSDKVQDVLVKVKNFF